MTGHFLTNCCSLAFACGVVFAALPCEGDDAGTVLARAGEHDREQQILARKLIAIASDASELPPNRQIALEHLGRMPTRVAIDGLLDNLLFKEAIITELTLLAGRPAAKALASIGSPAFAQIWNRINRECSDEYVFVLASTIYKIDGKDVALTRLRLKQGAADTTVQQKTNLARLIKLFETVDLNDPNNAP